MRRITFNVLACGIVLSLVVAACGDDDTSDTSAAGSGGGGSSAGKGGSSSAGKGGSSSAGKGGTGGSGGTIDPATCKTETDKIATKLPSGCSMCACTQDAKMTTSCDAACWDLFACTGAKCAGTTGSAAQTCAQAMCMPEITASLTSGSVGVVQSLGMILQGSACGSVCDMSGADAGM